MTNKEDILKRTEDFAKNFFQKEYTGHDWWHTSRVRVLARKIAVEEKADLFIVEMAALLHDVSDYKFFGGDDKAGLSFVQKWLSSLEISKREKEDILKIISHISFKNTLPGLADKEKDVSTIILSKEFMAVCDADRLDSIGAIGIARAFTFGGFYKRKIYEPSIRPNKKMTQEEYKTTDAPSINHFYEKLLKIKDMIYTKLGKKIARKRHRFLNLYLKEFYKEWKGKL